MGTKVVVTGGAGFIGSHLATAFVDRGASVTVIDNFATGYRRNLSHLGDQVEIIEGDVRDAALLKRVFAGARFVLHQAAVVSVPHSMTHPELTEEVNAMGTLRVLNAAREAGVERVTLAASAAAYGQDPTLPKVETMTPRPVSPYAVTKISAELYAHMFTESYGLPVFPLRYFNIYGARQDPSGAYAAVISKFVERFMADKEPLVFGDGLQTRDFCHVSDVVRANVLALTEAPASAAGQPINIGTGRSVTLLDLIAALGRIFEREPTPVFKETRAGDVRHSRADISRATALLGYLPQTSLEEGLRELVASLQETP